MNNYVLTADNGATYTVCEKYSRIATIMNFSKPNDNEKMLSEEEAKAIALEYLKALYPEFDLSNIHKSDSNSNLYYFNGSSYHKGGSIFLDYFISLDYKGDLQSFSTDIYEVAIKDCMQKTLTKLSNGSYEFVEFVPSPNGLMYNFDLEGGYSVLIYEVDGSIQMLSNNNVGLDIPYSLNTDDIQNYATEYFNEYLPEYKNVLVSKYKEYEGAYSVEVEFVDESGQLKSGILSLAGDGQFRGLSINFEEPVKYDDDDKIPIEDCVDIAIDVLMESGECDFADRDKFKLVKSIENTSENTPNQYLYFFEYEHDKTKLEGKWEYSFTAMAGVNKYDGSFGRSRVTPILYELYDWDRDDIIEQARNYCGNQVNPKTDKGIDIDDLELYETFFTPLDDVEYTVVFEIKGTDLICMYTILAETEEFESFYVELSYGE